MPHVPGHKEEVEKLPPVGGTLAEQTSVFRKRFARESAAGKTIQVPRTVRAGRFRLPLPGFVPPHRFEAPPREGVKQFAPLTWRELISLSPIYKDVRRAMLASGSPDRMALARADDKEQLSSEEIQAIFQIANSPELLQGRQEKAGISARVQEGFTPGLTEGRLDPEKSQAEIEASIQQSREFNQEQFERSQDRFTVSRQNAEQLSLARKQALERVPERFRTGVEGLSLQGIQQFGRQANEEIQKLTPARNWVQFWQATGQAPSWISYWTAKEGQNAT